MAQIIRVLSLLVLVFGPLTFVAAGSAAAQGLRWDIETDRNSFTLTLRQSKERAALPFNAQCEENGDLKLTIGAPLDKVQKAGEPVTLKLEAGGKTATISGKAVFNEFTKAMELAIETDVNNGVFAVLTAGKPIQVTSTAKTPATWPAPKAAAVKLWTVDCQYRSEH